MPRRRSGPPGWLILGAVTVAFAAFLGGPRAAEARARLWERVLQQRYEKARRLAYLADLAGQNGQHRVRIRYLRRAVGISPQRPSLWYEIARSYLKLSRPIACVNAARRARKVDPKFRPASVAFLLGVCLGMRGRLAEALVEYRQVKFTKNANQRVLLGNLADTLMSLGRLDEAILVYHKALKLGPTEALLYYSLAVAYDRQAHPGLADRYARYGLRFDPQAKALDHPSLFFVPTYERHYFDAIIATARERRLEALRQWVAYQKAAPPHDPWRFSVRRRRRSLPRQPLSAQAVDFVGKVTDEETLRAALVKALMVRYPALQACLPTAGAKIDALGARVQVALAGTTLGTATLIDKLGPVQPKAETCLTTVLKTLPWNRLIGRRPTLTFLFDVVAR